MDTVHLRRIREMSDEQRSRLVIRYGTYPVAHETLADIEKQLMDYVTTLAYRWCPIASTSHA